MKITGKAVLNPGTPDEIWGIGESFDVGYEADKTIVKDGMGQTAAVIHGDFRTKYSGTYTPLKLPSGEHPALLPAEDIIGSIMEIKPSKTAAAPIKILIDDAQLKYKSGDKSTFSFTGYTYKSIDLTQSNVQEVIDG